MTFNDSFLKAYWYTDLLIYKYCFKGNHLLLSLYLNHFILAPKSFNCLLGTETARGRNHLLKILSTIFCSRMWLVTLKDCFPTHENKTQISAWIWHNASSLYYGLLNVSFVVLGVLVSWQYKAGLTSNSLLTKLSPNFFCFYIVMRRITTCINRLHCTILL